MNLCKFVLTGAGVLCSTFFVGASAQAIVVFDFDDLVTGFTPGGSAPWATLTIQDAGADTVDLTLSHNASSSSGQFIRTLWLNMDPYPASPQLIETSPKIVGHQFSQDGLGHAGLQFDVQVDFEPSNSGGGVNRLKPGESVSWQITGVGLNENAFNVDSGGNQARKAMIHLQGIEGDLSGHIAPVPEPSTIAGLGLAAVALFGRRRRKA